MIDHLREIVLLWNNASVFSVAELRGIRRSCSKRPRLQQNVFNRMKELGLFRFRGCRAGQREILKRQNESRSSCRNVVQYSSVMQSLPDVNKLDININEMKHRSPSIITNRFGNIDRPKNAVNTNNLLSVKCSQECSRPSVVMCLMNCQSMNEKDASIGHYILNHKVGLCIAALTETWLRGDDHDNVIINKLVPSGYRMHHVPRVGSKDGSVGLIWKDQYAMKLQPSIEVSSFESSIMLATLGSKFYCTVTLYRPTPSTKNKIKKSLFIQEFADLLEQAATWTGQVIILGDFNIHWDADNDTEKRDLCNLLDSFEITQHVDGPTHTEGHTLDLVMSRTEEDSVSSCSVSDFMSDHNAIFITLSTSRLHPPRKTTIY